MKFQDIPPIARCTECGEHMNAYQEFIGIYFSEIPVTCSKCNAVLDWWKVALKEIQKNFMLNSAFMQIGAKSTHFSFTLKPNTRTKYKLSDYGIPETARILYVNYTPYTEGGGGYFPIEMTGNIPTRKFPRNEVTLWPVPIGEGVADSTEVMAYVTWVEHSDLDESWDNLVSAFEFYASEQYESAIVPANVAVESALSIFLTHCLGSVAGKERVKTFLEDGATYSHQLHVVLPLIAKLYNFAELPCHIRGNLNKLRSLRNQMAHNGKTDKPLIQETAAEVLCSALFGFRYIQYAEESIAGKKI